LQELVYKQGQAGITKATVTIIFNNSDASTSPIGYEEFKQISVTRQIAIGGKNKFMINGHTVQQSQIQNFFHSVQLNVNNPHFLIMQGRITKVLNMKPAETLSMIEEAAGTRMYETKKQASLKTLEKKDAKVAEINKCINEEIIPTLDNLRQERTDYHKFQKNQIEYEKLFRLTVAHEFQQNEDKLKNSENTQLEINNEIKNYEIAIQDRNNAIVGFDNDIQAIILKKDSELDTEINRLKDAGIQKSKEIVKMDTLLKNHAETVNSESTTQTDLTRSLQQLDNTLALKKKNLTNLNKDVEEKEKSTKEAETHYQVLQEKYQNFVAGKTDEKTTELLSVQEQLITWEKSERETLSKLQTTAQNNDFQQKKLKEFNKKYSSVLNSSNSSYDKIQVENENLKASINQKEDQLTTIQSPDDKMRQLSTEISNLNNQLSTIQQNSELLNVSLQVKLSFDFTNPEKNFNREERVKGFIANLFSFNEKKFALPLEVIAGGKLLQIVVDSEQTGKLLLTKGNLKRRVTILPLNKLSARPIPKDKMAKAKQIAKEMGGSAFLALEVIQYSSDVSVAMEYTFGSTIICSSIDIAKTIAFHKDIKSKTVTFEGDSYDPAGILTGGSNSSLGNLLSKLQEVRELKQISQEKTTIKNKLTAELKQLEERNVFYNNLVKEIDLLKHNLLMNEQKLLENDFTQILLQRQEIEKEIIKIEEQKQQLEEQLNKIKSELTKLSKLEKSNNKSKETKVKEFEKEIKTAQQDFNSLKNQLISLNSKKEAILMEIKSLEKEFQSQNEQKSMSDSSLVKLLKEKRDMEEKVKKISKFFNIFIIFILVVIINEKRLRNRK
jgi:structural maintenance of chromosome 2